MNNKSLAELEEEYSLLRSKGRRYLRRGVIFLALCLVLGQAALRYDIPFAGLISESATVAGWVALWRPMEIFLYDLSEVRNEIKIAKKI